MKEGSLIKFLPIAIRSIFFCFIALSAKLRFSRFPDVLTGILIFFFILDAILILKPLKNFNLVLVKIPPLETHI